MTEPEPEALSLRRDNDARSRDRLRYAEILTFLDGCRARGALAIEITTPEGVQIKANLSALQLNELPADAEARAKLLADPKTPQEVKARIAAEDEEDLFAAAT